MARPADGNERQRAYGRSARHYDETMMTLVTAPDVLHHATNRAGRDFVIGDLHGCVDALRYLLREVRFDAGCDRLFSVGDLVDRGTQCDEAIALLDRPWFHPVLGNHEDALCAVVDGRLSRRRWYAIGGGWAESVPDDRLAGYARRLRELPLVRVVGSGAERFNVLHAEFFGDDTDLDAGGFDDDVREQMLWGRTVALGRARPSAGLSVTYCGHTPMRDVTRVGSQVFIDTGAFAEQGRLTLVEAHGARHWSVSVETARAEGAAAFALP
ncbi:serine/threonine protein phosphatase 1 [Paraburkholderia caballeronis]|nr:serine/threonine protein phosphatase 1 [Paraburkholderia caballeronis]TDV21930.1 serine/threonine protein phosphatase 1 [Paraburkholderia caballeronis]TDV28833.1 serine/threonine protein phosphatase 1 [Paraburkholderia caballeronis]